MLISQHNIDWPVESEKSMMSWISCPRAGFIGYAKDVYNVITKHPVENTDDDQLYYTKVFLGHVNAVTQFI